MSYYILPKNNNNNIFEPKQSLDDCNIILSHSLNYYLNEQNTLCPYNEEMFKYINPYEFIFSKVPGYKFSVSKLKPPNNYFYILMEISNIFNLFDSFSKKNITTMHFSPCPESTIECLDILREDKQDVHLKGDFVNPIKNDNINNIDFLYFDIDDNYTNLEYYFKGLVLILLNILIYQSKNGISVIKMDNLFYKPILDFIFFLTGIFDKVYIIKPNTSNIFKNERFLICKFFNNYIEKQNQIDILNFFITNYNSKNGILHSLYNIELPYYFLARIEESNIIIGQQQLEAYDLVINISKNKNKDEKLENIKKNNIQKCIQICEKFKIPYNKFTDKVNIFLQGHNVEEFVPNLFLHPVIKENDDNNYQDEPVILDSVFEDKSEIFE
jgi:hypothetical protein